MEQVKDSIQVANSLRTILVLNAPSDFTLTKIKFVKLLMIFVKHGVMKMEIVSPAIKDILLAKVVAGVEMALAEEMAQLRTIYVINLTILVPV